MTNTTRTETPGGGWTIRCNECRAKVGASPAFPCTAADIKHRPECSAFAHAIAVETVATAEQIAIAKQGGVSHSGLTEDEIAENVAAGRISANDALNRDY